MKRYVVLMQLCVHTFTQYMANKVGTFYYIIICTLVYVSHN